MSGSRFGLNACVLVLSCGFLGASADDRIILKDGFELTGKIDLNENRITVQSGARTVYVSPKMLLKPEPGDLGSTQPRFTLPQPQTSPGIGPGTITRIHKMETFDEHGRRSFEADVNKRKVTLIQAITELYPTHVVVKGMNHGWTTHIALGQI